MSEIDLTKGDPDAAEKIAAAGSSARRGRRGKSSDSSGSKGTTTKAAREAQDRTLKGELLEMFHDFAESFQEHDPELADILERRREAMSQGLVALTRKIGVLRGPVVLFVAFFQPVLAFWELGSYAVRRYVARQQRKANERRAAANGVEVTDVTGNESHGYAS